MAFKFGDLVLDFQGFLPLPLLPFFQVDVEVPLHVGLAGMLPSAEGFARALTLPKHPDAVASAVPQLHEPVE